MTDTTWDDPRPIEIGESFITYTDPITLASGHPLRGERCVLCGMIAGGRPVMFAQVIIADEAACVCGQLPGTSRLICGEHGEPDCAALVAASLRALIAAHPKGAHRG